MRRAVPPSLTISAGVCAGVAGSVALSRGRFVLGGALSLIGVLLLAGPTSIWSAPSSATPSPSHRRIALLAVCVIAAFLRLYHLEPPGLWGDDALNGLLALDVLDGRIRSPFELVRHSHSYFHALSNYAVAASFSIFGPGPAALRLPGVVANSLAVPLLYGTFAPLLGARVALIACLFFAFSPMQLAHARSLIQINLGELFQLAGLCLLVRGVTGGRRWLIGASGAPLALCLYTYHSAKIAPLVAVAYFAAALVSSSRRKSLLLWGLACLAVFAACSVPFIWSWRESADLMTGRIEGTSVLNAIRVHGWRVLWDSFWRTMLVFHFEQGPQYHWFGLGFEPAFDWVLAFLMLPALATCIARWREPRHVLLLAWIGIGMVPGILSSEAPRAYRVLLATPPLYALAAWTVVHIEALGRSLAGAARVPLRALALALLLAVPLLDFNWYFFHTRTHPSFHYLQGERIVQMARALRRQGSGWIGYVLADSFDANHECLRFLARCWGLQMRNVANLGDVLPVRNVERGALFMMTGGTMGAASALSAWYPESRLELRYDSQLRGTFLDRWLFPAGELPGKSNAFFAVSREAADAKHGLRAALLDASGATLATRVDPAPRLDAASLPAEARRVRWSGALVAESDGAHRFIVQNGAGARLAIDGVEVVGAAPEGSIDLAAGPHLVELAADAMAAEFRVLWEPPGRALGELSPEALFRNPPIGLLAERIGNGRTLRRYDPYPYYAFFGDAHPTSSELRWFGKLRADEAGMRLRVEVGSPSELLLDGRAWNDNQTLAPGVHDLDLRLIQAPRRLILKLQWRRPDGRLDPVPAEAFSPPPSPAAAS